MCLTLKMNRIILFIGLLACLEAATVHPKPPTCPMDYQCQRGECCRDNSGNIVSTQGFGPIPSFNSADGTCSPSVAQLGEICDSNCHCKTGLECYRPVSGICCPPMKCYNATWVQQQRDYWAKCMADPSCGLPP